ncbi:uncharacterized protein H6S33_011597 [Morchella sextelata]|uniref:uncharacterized protein n=1 Tax=Morchella sextelata TaxID=1174677 RepID=UPI001D0452DC|nr:uncharacterized protein H6S33_011597 [Morchella sextelata]KAH0611170.1 hypothetical protein H6S33_011597 [Morchella sextelata]
MTQFKFYGKHSTSNYLRIRQQIYLCLLILLGPILSTSFPKPGKAAVQISLTQLNRILDLRQKQPASTYKIQPQTTYQISHPKKPALVSNFHTVIHKIFCSAVFRPTSPVLPDALRPSFVYYRWTGERRRIRLAFHQLDVMNTHGIPLCGSVVAYCGTNGIALGAIYGDENLGGREPTSALPVLYSNQAGPCNFSMSQTAITHAIKSPIALPCLAVFLSH